jgi:radical SAM protein with 4Fe4S-binding SPASM domain
MTVPDRIPKGIRGGLPGIQYCVWELTLACDLGCKHCGSRAGKARPDELTTNEALDVVAQLAAVGCQEVALIGGEAYLREDWDIIARAIVDAGMKCGMTTGARALTAERVERARAAGIRTMSLSVDGLRETHDSLRGAKGSWQAVMDAADRLGEAGIAFGFNTQINRLSLAELPALANLLVEKGAFAWQVSMTVPMGRAADRPDLLLQPADLLELFPLLHWLKTTRLEPAGIELQPGNDIGYFGGWEELLRIGGESGAKWSACVAGQHGLGIEADGSIKGCPSLPTAFYVGGNVRDIPIADIVADSPELALLRNRTVDDLWGFCRTCDHAERCLGGCSWTTHVYFGKPGNNPFCIHRVQTLEAQGIKETLVQKSPAAGRPFDHGIFEIVEEALTAESEHESTIAGVPLLEILQAGTSLPSLSNSDARRTLLTKRRAVG